MAVEVPVAMIVMTVMPPWPVIEPSVIGAIHRSVVAVTVIGIAVAVVMTVVIYAAEYQGRGNARADTPAPSMTMRFCTIGGADHAHDRESQCGYECCCRSRFH